MMMDSAPDVANAILIACAFPHRLVQHAVARHSRRMATKEDGTPARTDRGRAMSIDDLERMQALASLVRTAISLIDTTLGASPYTQDAPTRARFWAMMLGNVKARHAIELEKIAGADARTAAGGPVPEPAGNPSEGQPPSGGPQGGRTQGHA